jgi:hypothetical protein
MRYRNIFDLDDDDLVIHEDDKNVEMSRLFKNIEEISRIEELDCSIKELKDFVKPTDDSSNLFYSEDL